MAIDSYSELKMQLLSSSYTRTVCRACRVRTKM